MRKIGRLHLGFRTFYPALFILLGYLYKVVLYRLVLFRMRIFAFIGLCLVVVASFFLKTEMLKISTTTIIPYTIVALVGVISILNMSEILSAFIEKKRNTKLKDFLYYLGTRTFIVMTLHFLSFKIVTEVIIFSFNLPKGLLAAFPVISYNNPNNWWMLYTMIGVFCPLFFSYYTEIISSVINRRVSS